MQVVTIHVILLGFFSKAQHGRRLMIPHRPTLMNAEMQHDGDQCSSDYEHDAACIVVSPAAMHDGSLPDLGTILTFLL